MDEWGSGMGRLSLKRPHGGGLGGGGAFSRGNMEDV